MTAPLEYSRARLPGLLSPQRLGLAWWEKEPDWSGRLDHEANKAMMNATVLGLELKFNPSADRPALEAAMAAEKRFAEVFVSLMTTAARIAA
ncbi:hypothetical protein [uncultured Hyphomicrobium sp.]|uniref:hypothetical protein n=1 Tax=uncultured Hyphomicrobium sp. TaxID=194373 RepID=UPI0025DE0103|nr:hypothetical protein [uncultured Hyphomicrobium sp.]